MRKITIPFLISAFLLLTLSCSSGIALLQACKHNNIEKVKQYLENGADPNYRDPINGDFPLIISQSQSDEEITRLLIKHGADVNAINRNGKNALMVSAYYGRLINVKILMEKGARIDLKDKEGDTALIIALSNGHEDVAILLKRKGAID